MKKILSFFAISLLFAGVSFAQDYGTQIPNSDFESDWKKYEGGNKKLIGSENISGNEPYCWHSFKSAKGSRICLAAVSTQIEKCTDVRPGSKGIQSTKLTTTKTLGIIANGSLTNGRMNAGSTSADDNSNHIYTDRGTEEFHTEIDVVPDSITVWLCFYTTSDNYYAAFHAAVHGDSDFILYGNGKESDQDYQVADANCEYTRTTSDKSQKIWERKSIPFVAKGNCTTPKYILVTMSTNRTPDNGTEDDFVIVDDIALIYNPTLTTGTLAQTTYEAEASETIAMEVPFTLTGTMSVSNLNKAANQVIAQFSDANGSFDTPTEIGRVTTNTSGTISCNIPVSVGTGTYKVRVVSTNYPMTAEPSSSEITINRYYNIAFDTYDTDVVELTGDGKYFTNGDLNATISANILNADYKFAYWYENESVVSLEPTYSFTIDKSHSFTAVLQKQFTITATATEGGSVSSSGGKYSENEGVNFVATADEGYKFINWTVNDEEVSTSSSYTFQASENRDLVAHFAKYITISATTNQPSVGAISGAGDFIITDNEIEVTLTAVSNNADKYQFVNWTENGEIVSESASYSFSTAESHSLVANFVTRVIISANATTGGIVTGDGSYNQGESVSLIAFADEHFRFNGWYEADTLFSNETSLSILAEDDRTFEAQFVQQFSLNLTTNIANAGIVSGAGTYDANIEVRISTMANEGYNFVNWTINEAIVTDEFSTTITMDSSMTIVANFVEIPKYTISATASPTTGGTISGNGDFYENETTTLIATPNNGYKFINWTENDDEISTESTLTIEAIENRNLVANFEANFIGNTVTLTAEEGGQVSGAGLYEQNSSVEITAIPNEKYEFKAWVNQDNEVISTDATYTFTITDDIILTAQFTRIYQNFTITVTSANETAGTVEGAGEYKEDDEITVKANANDGYRFLQWTANESVVSTDAEYSFTCKEAVSLTAEFVKTYTITVDEFAGGSIKGLGSGIFDEGTTVTLICSVDENHRFSAWKDAEADTTVTTSIIYTFTASEDRHLALDITEKGKLCTISVLTGGTVSGLRNGLYEAGETLTLIATPNEGYIFNGWISNGEIISTNTLLTMEVSDDMNIYAEFVPTAKSVNVTVSINDDTFGTVLGAGTYTEGDEVQLIATPSVGYEFIGWTKNGKLLSNLQTLYVTVVEDCTIEAEFRFIEKIEEETSIEEETYTCSVYPTCPTTAIYITSDKEIQSIKIISAKGTEIYYNEIVSTQTSIDVSTLPKGVYFVLVNLGTKTLQREIIVK